MENEVYRGAVERYLVGRIGQIVTHHRVGGSERSEG